MDTVKGPIADRRTTQSSAARKPRRAEPVGASRGPVNGRRPWTRRINVRSFKGDNICEFNKLGWKWLRHRASVPNGILALAGATPKPHIRSMSTSAKKNGRTHASSRTGHTVVYRGVRIAPMSGPRSETARAIRDALRTEYRHSSGKTTRD